VFGSSKPLRFSETLLLRFFGPVFLVAICRERSSIQSRDVVWALSVEFGDFGCFLLSGVLSEDVLNGMFAGNKAFMKVSWVATA
jgi:hypothetical protein